MKKLLGSLFILINLYASEYFFETTVNKTQVYVNEPILLNVSFFKNIDAEYINSNFNPKIDNFEVKLLQNRVSGKDDYLVTNYKYQLTPLKEGNFTLNLKASVEEATLGSLENSTIGKDQTNFDDSLEKNKKSIDLTPLNIEVLTNSEPFVGNIEVKTKIDTTKAIANNPINFEVIVNFNGDIEKLSDINFSIDGVKIFADEPKKEFYFNNELKGSIKQKFALVANSNFSIPKIAFKYFNPKTARVQIASSKEIKVEIEPNKEIIKGLLDEPKEEPTLSYLKEILIYLFFTIFGFILCKLIKVPTFKKEVKNYEEIESAKTPKELLQILFKYHKNREILNLIERVEKVVYSNAKDNVKEIKKEVIEILKKFGTD